jgi:hypothetical protein
VFGFQTGLCILGILIVLRFVVEMESVFSRGAGS